MNKDQNKKLIKDVEKLLDSQTKSIISAVDKKLKKQEELLDEQTVVILSAVDEKLKASEERINQKIGELTTTIDAFLKRVSDIEDEFKAMKLDINRVKTVIREKLGVNLI